MVVIKLTEPLRLSDELWTHLVSRGVVSADMSDSSNLACYIQECLARDDDRVPVTLQNGAFATSVHTNQSAMTDETRTSVSTVHADGIAEVSSAVQQHTPEELQQPVEQSSPSTTQIMNRLNTLYNSGGLK